MMLRFLTCWALLWAAGFHVSAATDEAAGPPPANRFLLVIESSRAMQKRSEGISSAIETLLGSALKGQIRAGDTLGVWTFNNQLVTGEVPLQEWPRKAPLQLVARLGDYARNLKYEKDPDLTVLMPDLKSLFAESDFITVILITSGQDAITGTRFDAEINRYFDTWKTEQARKRMPFVTLLRAAGGQISHYAVAAFPWELELPPLPAALTNPPVKPKPVAVPQKPRTTNMLAPLIITGKKPEPPPEVKPAVTNVPSLTDSNPAPALAITNAPATNVAVVVPAPVSAPPTTSAVPEPVAMPVPAVPAAAVEPASATPPIDTPVEYPGGRQRLSWSTITLSVLGVVLLAAGGWLLLRPRPRSGKSLITSSLDREQRP